MSDKIREAFEARYPVPAGVAWNPYLRQYVLFHQKRSTPAERSAYVSKWDCWQAALAQQPATAAVPEGWRDVIENARESIGAGALQENANTERRYVEPYLDGIYDELEALEKEAAPAAQGPLYIDPPAAEQPDADSVSELLNLVMRCDITGGGVLAAQRAARTLLAAPAAPVAAGQEPSKLDKQLADEERSHGITIDQRDRAEEWATKLAEAVGEYFGCDVGEHSSANCPWENALELLNTAPPAAEHPGTVKVMRHTLARYAGYLQDAGYNYAAEDLRSILLAGGDKP